MSNLFSNINPTLVSGQSSEHLLIFDEDIEEFYEAFSQFKTGPEDIIEMKHFPKFMRLIGQNNTESEMIQMLREVGALEKKKITFDQILEVMRAHFQTPHTQEQIRKAFQVFDRDGGGCLTASEILHVLHQLGELHSEAEVKEVFLGTDTDHDMKISVEDFINIMERSADGKPRMTMPHKFKLM